MKLTNNLLFNRPLVSKIALFASLFFVQVSAFGSGTLRVYNFVSSDQILYSSEPLDLKYSNKEDRQATIDYMLWITDSLFLGASSWGEDYTSANESSRIKASHSTNKFFALKQSADEDGLRVLEKIKSYQYDNKRALAYILREVLTYRHWLETDLGNKILLKFLNSKPDNNLGNLLNALKSATPEQMANAQTFLDKVMQTRDSYLTSKLLLLSAEQWANFPSSPVWLEQLLAQASHRSEYRFMAASVFQSPQWASHSRGYEFLTKFLAADSANLDLAIELSFQSWGQSEEVFNILSDLVEKDQSGEMSQKILEQVIFKDSWKGSSFSNILLEKIIKKELAKDENRSSSIKRTLEKYFYGDRTAKSTSIKNAIKFAKDNLNVRRSYFNSLEINRLFAAVASGFSLSGDPCLSLF